MNDSFLQSNVHDESIILTQDGKVITVIYLTAVAGILLILASDCTYCTRRALMLFTWWIEDADIMNGWQDNKDKIL